MAVVLISIGAAVRILSFRCVRLVEMDKILSYLLIYKEKSKFEGRLKSKWLLNNFGSLREGHHKNIKHWLQYWQLTNLAIWAKNERSVDYSNVHLDKNNPKSHVVSFFAHVPKGYIYAAMAFSAFVEGLNMLARRRRKKAWVPIH